MPLRFVSIESTNLYSAPAGDDVCANLPLGTRIDVETFQKMQHGRVRARHGDVLGWIIPGQLTANGLGLLAGARRSGVALPENQPTSRRPTAIEAGVDPQLSSVGSESAESTESATGEPRTGAWGQPVRLSSPGPSERNLEPDSMLGEVGRLGSLLSIGLAL